MADLDRSGNETAIINANEELLKFHNSILISEMVNQIKSLDIQLERMKTVDMKRIELKKQTLAKQIIELRTRAGVKPEPISVVVDVNSKEE